MIPTHRPMIRKDNAGLRLPDAERQVQGDHRGHPRLRRARAAGAGRHDLDRDLRAPVRRCCRRRASPHQVLNAKQHEREADIVAQAGRPGAVTIATNMAGRGTDIVLGGNLEAELARRSGAGASSTSRRASASAPNGRRGTRRCWPRAACTSSAPSGTSRAASTTSCAAARAARATRARAASTCRWKTT